MRFLNAVCDMWRRGLNRYEKPMPTLFHTSHPGLSGAIRRDPKWCQVSCSLYGGHKGRSMQSVRRSAIRKGQESVSSGYGGHFRAVQGFRYLGDADGKEAEAVAAPAMPGGQAHVSSRG